jgi:hypothetical protein
MMTRQRAGATMASAPQPGGLNAMQATSGPIEVLGVEFDGDARFEGQIAGELERLERDSLVKVLAVLFVRKDATTGELEALDLETAEDGEVTDVLAGDAAAAEHSTLLSALGLSLDDVYQMAADLDAGTSAGLILMEHLWARGLHEAIRDTHGTPFLQGFLMRQGSPQAGG